MCVHEKCHLELILQDYLVSMWYVILMRNLNSIMSINYLLIGSLLPLVKINSISHYGGVISFVNITSLENVNI